MLRTLSLRRVSAKPLWLVFAWIVVLPNVFCLAQEVDDEGLQPALAVVAAAQPEGVDSEQVAAAWQVVSRVDAEQLPMVLVALDGASGLSAHWISAALDRIVERSRDSSQPLPVAAISRVVLEPKHALLTRKTALDLLADTSPDLVDQLQEKLIYDAEAELRRPALAKAMARAEALTGADATVEEQISAWLELLAAARDQDHVTRIARVLRELGHAVDLNKQFGYLVDWWVIGPFDNSGGNHFDTFYAPEKLTIEQFETLTAGNTEALEGANGPAVWKAVRAKADSGDVNLNEELGKLRDVLGYGATVFVTDQARSVDVRLRIQNAFKIWLNGKLLMEQPVGHTGNSFDQYRVAAELQAGRNLLVVKSCQVNLRGAGEFYDTWHFCVRVCDATGAAVLSMNQAASP